MADARILLHRAADGSARLLLGSQAGGGGAAQLQLSGSAGLGGLACALRLRVLLQVSGSAGLSGLACTGALRYQSQAQRPTVGAAAQGWQSARASAAPLQAAHHTSRAQPAGSASAWQRAQALGQLLRQLLPPMLAPLPLARRSAHCRALPQHSASRWRHDAALRQDVPQQAPWQRALAQQLAVLFLQQDGLRQHLRARSAWQGARPLALPAAAHWQGAHAAPVPCAGRWQRALPPAPGRWQRPTPPTPEPPCLGVGARIVLVRQADGRGKIVLVCQGGTEPQRPHYQIPIRRVYVTHHAIAAYRLPDGAPVPLLDCSVSTDDQSWCWSLEASGPELLLQLLAPGAGGLPTRLALNVDGVEFVFIVERLARTRQFGLHRVSLQGRSVTALLGAPYMPQAVYDNNAAPITARQAAEAALQYSGVGLSWSTVDWLLPAGAWGHSGTPLSAVLQIAQATDAVVRSHRSEAQLQLAPRYAAAPWDWASTQPDVTLPADIIIKDSSEPDIAPQYNAVYVCGQAHGVLARAVRSGTAGDVQAPQVVDALITHPDAARARATAVLCAAGAKQRIGLDMPLLTGAGLPGLIEPGQLLQVGDLAPALPWRGIVRSVNLRVGLPSVRQSVVIERRAIA